MTKCIYKTASGDCRNVHMLDNKNPSIKKCVLLEPRSNPKVLIFCKLERGPESLLTNP